MPATYTFYAADGTTMYLRDVDDIVREILGLPVDKNSYCNEYDALTWAVLAHKNWDDMEKNSKSEIIQNLARGMRDRGITYSTGRASKWMCENILQ